MGKWYPDGTGVLSNADVGGDRQVGDSYSVRFHHNAELGALTTISFYVVKDKGDPGTYNVEREHEWMVCRDRTRPGDTEEWADYDTDTVEYGIRGKRKAEAKAKWFAETTTADEVTWTGVPD